jgi:hypothetical protein
MKNKLILLSLMVLPIILFLLEIILKHSRGEYFLYDNYDGPYGFLLASLNMAQFLKPGYFQHPGIIPLLIEASTIKFSHFLQGNDPNIVTDTFTRPEFYFNRINIVFAFLTSFSLFILGKLSYEKTGSVLGSIFLQFTPFVSVLIIYQLTHNYVSASTVILIIVLLTVSISYLNEISFSKKKNYIYIISFGIICGLLLANLISLLPVFIIPFLLIKTFKNKFIFVSIALITFFVLFFSISPDSSAIWKFVFSNIVHSGKYGTGNSNFIDLDRIIPTFAIIFYEFLFFLFVYLLILILLILQFIPRLKIKIRSNKYFELLVGIFIVMTMYILLVIKQKEGYYILPGLLFTVTGLFILNSIVLGFFKRHSTISKYLFLYIFIIIFTIPQIKSYNNYVSFYVKRKYESYKVVKFLKENYPNTITVSSDQTASMQTAFFNALNYTGDQKKKYIDILNEKYPNYVYFQRWRKDFIYLDYNEDLKNRFVNSDSLIFHSFNEKNFNDFKEKFIDYSKKPNITFKEVYSNKNGEKIYLVKMK